MEANSYIYISILLIKGRRVFLGLWGVGGHGEAGLARVSDLVQRRRRGVSHGAFAFLPARGCGVWETRFCGHDEIAFTAGPSRSPRTGVFRKRFPWHQRGPPRAVAADGTERPSGRPDAPANRAPSPRRCCCQLPSRILASTSARTS